MFVVGNLFAALAQIVQALFTIYTWLIIIRVLSSWVSPDPFNPIVQFLIKATDPVLEPLRRIIPTIGPIDISPIAALLVIQALQVFLVRTLIDLSLRLR